MRDAGLVAALVALAALGPLAVAGGSPAGAVEAADLSRGGLHGNHVTVDPQVAADGTVVAETAASLTSGFLVVRADAGGRPGAPLGHTSLDGAAFRTDVAVALDSPLADARTLWAVVHVDDGDGEFDPATDRSVAARSPGARQSFVVRGGDRPVHVLARGFDPLALADGALTVRRVSLARPGYVVAHPIDGDGVVGTRKLSAGTHANVTLSLDDSFVAARGDRFRLRLVAYRDDGDGRFDDGDRPVRVGGEAVGTDVVVDRSGSAGTDDGPAVVTPTPAPDRTGRTRPPSTAATPTTRGSGPGFGVAVALCCLLAVGAGARRGS